MPPQLTGLQQRMDLLNSFVDNTKNSECPLRFTPGQLTIVDLSDPFIDPAQACSIFEIFVRLFVRARVDTGKVLVVDEAHKVSLMMMCCSSLRLKMIQYLDVNEGKSGLTKELLSLVRQQRHLAMRVVISTQGWHLDLTAQSTDLSRCQSRRSSHPSCSTSRASPSCIVSPRRPGFHTSRSTLRHAWTPTPRLIRSSGSKYVHLKIRLVRSSLNFDALTHTDRPSDRPRPNRTPHPLCERKRRRC